MEIMNTSTWANDSRFLQNALNNSFDIAANNPSEKMAFLSFGFLLSVLGLPGNLFVTVVYFGNLETSTRVYMFALSIADSAVCVCGIFLIIYYTDFVTVMIFISIFSATMTFSMFLLAFVSIERLIAVKRPHTFNMTTQRAKKAIIVLAVAAFLFTTVTTITYLKEYTQLTGVIKLSTILTCVFVMTTCYTLLVLMLLKRYRGSKYHNKERSCPSELTSVTITVTPAIESVADPPGTELSNISTNMETSYPVPSDPSAIYGAMRPASVPQTRKYIKKQDSMYRNVVLLFIISVVFVVCWLPEWMVHIGLNIPEDGRRIFVLNSVVNPFIYSLASAMFREDVRKFFRQTRARLIVCNL